MDSPLANTVSTVSTASFIEQRRCTRLFVAVPVILVGKDSTGRKFLEETRTLSINRMGAAIETSHPIVPGVELLIKNASMGVTVRARALRWRRRDREMPFLAVELLDVKNVWGIQYPPADWRLAGISKRAPSLPKVIEVDLSDALTAPPEDEPALDSLPNKALPSGMAFEDVRSGFENEIVDAAKAARELSDSLEALLHQAGSARVEKSVTLAAHDLIGKFTLHLDSINHRLTDVLQSAL